MNRHCLIAAALTAFAGCGPGPDLDLAQASQAVSSDVDEPAGSQKTQALNGTSVTVAGPIMSGCELGGARSLGTPLPQGCSNNGPEFASSLAYVSLATITAPDGSPVDGAALEGTRLTGRVNGMLMGDVAFEGAQLIGTATNGGTVLLRLDKVTPGRPGGRQADVWRYDFEYRNAKGEWKRLCEHGHDKAVIVSGQWDYHEGYPGDGSKTNNPAVFTIGCRRSAIEKCINGGYKPWAAIGGVSLDGHHQACVRMMRADYCGDGVSHTTEGRQINLYDRVGLEVDDKNWVAEAEWTPAGARCLSPLNLSEADAPCAPLLGMPACGQSRNFGADTLLVSETPHIGGRDGRYGL